MIALAKERFTKNLWTERATAERPALVVVRDETDQATISSPKKFWKRARAGMRAEGSGGAVPRRPSFSGPLEIELTRRNIPFVKFGGLKFLDSAHVKDLLAFLRFVAKSARPRLRFPPAATAAGHRPGPARRILDADRAASRAAGDPRRPAAPPAKALAAFVARSSRPSRAPSAGPRDLGACAKWYEPHLERLHEDSVTRQIDLAQLEQIAATYPSREKFLTELTLDPPDATSAEAGVPLRDEDYLILSTIHSAKGQEWKSVFVLNVVDGCIPSDLATGTSAEIEEERRLLYVAMTRAKDHLAAHHAAALLHPRPARARRPPRLCRAQPASSRRAHALVRASAWPPAVAQPAGFVQRPGRRSTSARGCAACGAERPRTRAFERN